jgi:hypothetical protein
VAPFVADVGDPVIVEASVGSVGDNAVGRCVGDIRGRVALLLPVVAGVSEPRRRVAVWLYGLDGFDGLQVPQCDVVVMDAELAVARVRRWHGSSAELVGGTGQAVARVRRWHGLVVARVGGVGAWLLRWRADGPKSAISGEIALGGGTSGTVAPKRPMPPDFAKSPI